jgi:hypothetical protein
MRDESGIDHLVVMDAFSLMQSRRPFPLRRNRARREHNATNDRLDNYEETILFTYYSEMRYLRCLTKLDFMLRAS